MDSRQRRIARARLLRRQGTTYDEIRSVIGPVDDSTLRVWLRGIPRPPETHRTCRRDDVRRECRRLRAQGFTVPQIADKTGASKGSVSPWVAGIRPPPRAMERRSILSQEGAKAKPWRRGGSVDFINSDVDVLRTFLSWLDLLGVPAADRKLRLCMHESADVERSERWWSEQLGFQRSSLAPTALKRHRPLTVRRNVGDSYHRCLRVQIARSGKFYCAIEGWWRAIAEGCRP